MSTSGIGVPYTGGVGSRREARERALELLYEAETKDVETSELVVRLPLRPDVFTVELIDGVEANREALDTLIARFARGWSLERMAMLDRAIMRLATFELAYRPEIPTAAVISEAVELAKRFSTVESGKFVNGILSAIADDVRTVAHVETVPHAETSLPTEE